MKKPRLKLKAATRRYAVLGALAFGLVGVLGAAAKPTPDEAADASRQSEARLVAALSCTRADEATCR